MNPDNFQQAWQTQSSQSRLTIDADLLLKEVQRNQRAFTAALLWRDVREVGTALLLVPLWFYLGARLSLPWAWYLTAPALVWMAGFMLAHRMRQKRQPPQPSQSLHQCVQSSLAQVEHQIWLLRNVLWWCVLPLGLPMLAFLGQIAWEGRAGGWLTALAMGGVGAVVVGALASVIWFNQKAIRLELGPRRQELETLLASLQDETRPAS
jgi:thiosulfate reductase cytochrome b subunit